MATKLDLSLSASLPEGDHALICLVGGNGELVPSLDKDLAAAVILDRNNVPKGIKDSKLLTPGKRSCLYPQIVGSAASVGVAAVSAQEVDRVNVLNASLLAMGQAVSNMGLKPDVALIDGNKVPDFPVKAESIIKGDEKIACIAAASIVAKVARDKMITKIGKKFKGYYWDQNYGYGTKQHLKAIKSLGITSQHRKTFSPINKMR